MTDLRHLGEQECHFPVVGCTCVTQQQRYRVIDTFGGVELREYARCTLAEIQVEGSAEEAGNHAFRPLVSYIGGQNQDGGKFAMTAPVIQEPTDIGQEMPSPMLQESTAPGLWTVSFVLPGDGAIDAYPQPTDSRVRLREVAPRRAAALRWSGRWTSANVAKRTRELLSQVEAAGWEAEGQPRWARFDPPWKPAFARRNEIVVTVSDAAGSNGALNAH